MKIDFDAIIQRMRTLIIVLFVSQTISSQVINPKYYFTLTGDTVLFPGFCTNDSTHFIIASFKKQEHTFLKRFAIKGYDNFVIPESILNLYNLKYKGIKLNSDSAGTDVLVKEKILRNNEIGFSLEEPMKLFEVKIQINVICRGKSIPGKFTTVQNYDAIRKKDFKKEKFYRYNIIQAEHKAKYFITLSPYTHHPAGFDLPWEILEDFMALIDLTSTKAHK